MTITFALRALQIGQRITVQKPIKRVHDHIASAKKGSSRWYTARTLQTGVEVTRTE